jgi:hypothetical protein
MSVSTASEWKRLGDEALGALIVDDSRRAWILATYPPNKEAGRPGILVVTPRGQKKRQRVREMDVDAPEVDGKPKWRVGWEYSGDESALELAGVAAD